MIVPVPKPKTKRDPKYLAWIRTLPCCVCGSRSGGNVVAHHESILGRGHGIKASDYETLPMCDGSPGCHPIRHAMGKLSFYQFTNLDYKKEIIKNLIEYFGK